MGYRHHMSGLAQHLKLHVISYLIYFEKTCVEIAKYPGFIFRGGQTEIVCRVK